MRRKTQNFKRNTQHKAIELIPPLEKFQIDKWRQSDYLSEFFEHKTLKKQQ